MKEDLLGPGPGFEPGLGDPQARFPEELLPQLAFLLKNNLQEFAKSEEMRHVSELQKRKYLNALKKMAENTDVLRTVLEGRGSKNQTVALRKFVKFLLFEKRLITASAGREVLKKLKVPRSKPVLSFYTDKDIISLLKKIKNKKAKLLLRLAIESGLRRSHIVEAFNKIALGKYELHGDIAIVFLNKTSSTKRAFVCFCSKILAEEIKRLRQKVSIHSAAKLTIKHKVQWNKIRKWHATTLLSLGVPSEVVDFLEGRVPRTILAQHYLNLLTLAKKYYPRFINYVAQHIYSHLQQ